MAFVLRAFQKGADGVLIGGCWLGECHYVTEGNYDALNMMHLCRRLLEHEGVNPERLRLEWIAASEGNRFAQVMNDFARTVTELGPLGDGEGLNGDELASRLESVIGLVPYIKLMKSEKLAQRPAKPEDYDQLYTSEEIDTLLRDVVSYYIDPDKCQACLICGRRCPVDGISGGKNQVRVIDQDSCIRCGTCFDVCPPQFGAVRQIVGEPVPPPLPEEERTVVRKKKAQLEAQ